MGEGRACRIRSAEEKTGARVPIERASSLTRMRNRLRQREFARMRCSRRPSSRPRASRRPTSTRPGRPSTAGGRRKTPRNRERGSFRSPGPGCSPSDGSATGCSACARLPGKNPADSNRDTADAVPSAPASPGASRRGAVPWVVGWKGRFDAPARRSLCEAGEARPCRRGGAGAFGMQTKLEVQVLHGGTGDNRESKAAARG